MKVNWNKLKLSKEEKQIERAIAKGEYANASPSHMRQIAESIARYRKDAVLSIRINQGTLDGLKRNAKRYGVPYQKFITEILHRYAA